MGSEFISVIVLAAGESRRFGSPKQLAELDGRSLLELAYERSTSLDLKGDGVCLRTILVLGAHASEIQSCVKCDHWSKVVVCDNWDAGMRASIQCGFEAAFADAQEHHANLQGAVLCLVDQPLIRVESLVRLTRLGMQKRNIVCAAYGDLPGPPAYFPEAEMKNFCAWNSELDNKSLEKQGAKRFILSRPHRTLKLEEQELIDIDTPQALAQLKKSLMRKKT